jgi:hypothetical protein
MKIFVIAYTIKPPDFWSKNSRGKELGKISSHDVGNAYMLNFMDHLTHIFNFWAKQHGTVSFKQCQIPWILIGSFMMLAHAAW